MRTLTVNLQERSYNIYIDSGNLPAMAENLQQVLKANKVLVVTNFTILNIYQQELQEILQNFSHTIVLVPDGEEAKTLLELEKLYTAALSAGLDRKSAIVAFGGGVVGDVAGFLAATLFRGIGFIQIPTTLLAQVDSSVGGKVAVNHKLGKNLIGAFYQPQAVFIDTMFLKTLPLSELKCGLGEVLKYALIKDKEFFQYLSNHVEQVYALEKETLEEIIAVSCNIKSQIVSEDEKETNVRAILNFGHTIGHALENIIGYGIIKHGEAVSIGMAQALRIAHNLKMLKTADYEAMRELITKYQLPQSLPPHINLEHLLEVAYGDKKTENRLLTFVLTPCIGEAIIEKGFTKEKILGLLV